METDDERNGTITESRMAERGFDDRYSIDGDDRVGGYDGMDGYDGVDGYDGLDGYNGMGDMMELMDMMGMAKTTWNGTQMRTESDDESLKADLEYDVHLA